MPLDPSVPIEDDPNLDTSDPDVREHFAAQIEKINRIIVAKKVEMGPRLDACEEFRPARDLDEANAMISHLYAHLEIVGLSLRSVGMQLMLDQGGTRAVLKPLVAEVTKIIGRLDGLGSRPA